MSKNALERNDAKEFIVLRAIISADAWRIDGGPLLDSFEVCRKASLPEDVALRFYYETNGYTVAEFFTLGNLSEARIAAGSVNLPNNKGQPTRIECFSVVPFDAEARFVQISKGR